MKINKKMKKIFLLIIIIFSIVSQSVFAATGTINTDKWYVYNGSSKKHSFSIKFPTDWQVKTYGDISQSFFPLKTTTPVFWINEFEFNSYNEAVNSELNDIITLDSVSDFIFQTKSEDLIGKKAIYLDTVKNKKYAKTFIKRGSSIFSLTTPNLPDQPNFPLSSDINLKVSGIYNSFQFSDDWHEYINFKEKYSFEFPSKLRINNINNGVEIYDLTQFGNLIFQIIKYEKSTIDLVAENAVFSGEELIETKNINFHDIEKAISASYKRTSNGKNLNRIFVESDGNSFGMTDINIEKDFPHPGIYDQYIVEILDSFEFFDIEGEYYSYRYFPDVRDDHPNATAINSLKDQNVISGYVDGYFKPDNEISRAELTKLVVAPGNEVSSDKYSNCFIDVKEEWFAVFICYAKEQGWVLGYNDNSYKPSNKITRAEGTKIILETIYRDELDKNLISEETLPQDIKADDWFAPYYIFAEKNDLFDTQHTKIEGTSYFFFPNENMTRKEVSEMVYRSLLKINE